MLTDDQIISIACKHCKYEHESRYLYKQFEFKSSLVAFVRECIEQDRRAHPVSADSVAPSTEAACRQHEATIGSLPAGPMGYAMAAMPPYTPDTGLTSGVTAMERK